MKNVAILTDFVSHDPAYSLCSVAHNQYKMLMMNGYTPTFVVRKGFPENQKSEIYYGATICETDPGEIGNNVVNVTEKSDDEVYSLTNQLRAFLDGVDVVLTHDIIYQPNAWKYHVAIRRIAKENPNIFWLHWVHSTTPWSVSDQTKQFKDELTGKIGNSSLVVMNAEEIRRKADTFNYEINEVTYIPNPYDVAAYYTGEAKRILDESNSWLADYVAIYPARLDRGKQVEVVIEVMAGIAAKEFDVRVIVPDFHSTAGDKVTYRVKLKDLAMRAGVPIYFTSDLGGETPLYRVEHKTVIDLFDFADVFIHPSRSECDPLTLPEAMWKRNSLVLNFDLPMFRIYERYASMMGKFSSNVDALSGQAGTTDTSYGDRQAYMDEIGAGLLYMLQTSRLVQEHKYVRQMRSLHAVWKNNLYAAIEGS